MDQIDDRVSQLMRVHGVSTKTGFLAEHPLEWLPLDTRDLLRTAEFVRLDEFAYMLEDNVAHKEVARAVALLPMPSRSFEGLPEPVLYRLMLIYAMYAHAYFRETLHYVNVTELMRDSSTHFLPPQLAVPLWELSKLIGMRPTMPYELYGLLNWRLKNPQLPISLENLAMIHSFTGSESEHWFVNVHQAIEMEMVEGNSAFIKACMLSQDAVVAGNLHYIQPRELRSALLRAADSSYRAIGILRRMREHCDYRTYFDHIRLFYTFPCNMVYQGVVELKDEPQNYFGETGGQAPFQHLRLAVLGMDHEHFPYFPQMRMHMSSQFRTLIEWALHASAVRPFLLAYGGEAHVAEARDAYNHCVQAVVDWREFHLELARDYIFQYGDQHGTGTTPLDWLQRLIDHAKSFFITA